MLLGDIIKQYREKHKLSLQDFADLVHTSRSYIHMLEKNYNPATGKPISPSVETLKSISNAMNTDIEDILRQLDDNENIYLDENEYQKQFKNEELNYTMKNCSERLKKCRINNNFSIEYISQKINIPVNKIKRWEDGITSDIGSNTLSTLGDLYNVSPTWLMGYDVPMKRDYEKKSSDLSELIIKEYGKDSLMFLEDYNKLNEKGKKRARDNIKDLKKVGEYTCQDTETEQAKNA